MENEELSNNLLELKLLASMQKAICSINSSNIPQILTVILNSIFVHSPERIDDLVVIMLNTIFGGPTKLDPIANLIQALYGNINDSNDLSLLKQTILNRIFDPDLLTPAISSEITLLYFLYVYSEAINITIEDIIEGLSCYISKESSNKIFLSICFCYFGPKIQPLNEELFSKLEEEFHDHINNYSDAYRSYPDFFMNIIQIPSKSLIELHDAILADQFPGPVALMIIQDNADALDSFLAENPTFNLNSQLPFSTFLPCLAPQKTVNLIEFAAFYGAERIFKYMLEKGVPINTFSQNAYPLDLLALLSDNQEIIHIVQSNVHNPQPYYGSLAYFFKNDIIKGMLQSDDQLEDPARSRTLFFTQAASNGNYELIQFLYEEGININIPDQLGNTALSLAIASEQNKIADFLLSCPGINVQAQNCCGLNAAHRAAIIGSVRYLKKIADIDPDSLDAKCSSGRTPFVYACLFNKYDVIEYLLTQTDVDVNILSTLSQTPLHITSSSEFVDATRLLLSSPKVDINKCDGNGRTALHICAAAGKTIGVSVLLEHPNIDVNAKDCEGWTPLHLAAEIDSISVINVLLSHPNIDINCVDNDLMTPLHLAARSRATNVVSLLLQTPNINYNALDRRHRTALHIAALSKSMDIYELLSEVIDVSILDDKGRTAADIINGGSVIYASIF